MYLVNVHNTFCKCMYVCVPLPLWLSLTGHHTGGFSECLCPSDENIIFSTSGAEPGFGLVLVLVGSVVGPALDCFSEPGL